MKVRFLNLPEMLVAPLDDVKELLSFSVAEDGVAVEVQQNETGLSIEAKEDRVIVSYHRIPEFFRALTMLPAHIEAKDAYAETPANEDLCLMADCSRNAVFTVASAKRMIRYLALMGFTSCMLYTEDTYEVPEYPQFGYMRGRFTQEELKEIDRYAVQFGIEMIPCMQTLAHLEGSLRWPDFANIIDTGNILLVGNEKTYDFIEAMIRSCRACFTSKRIHIGMDEAHMLGLGRYLEENGFRNRSEILLEHLDRVVKICEKYEFDPMIWSDMFFRLAFNTYYVDKGEIPEEVIKLVPKNLTLVYWDYYTFPEGEPMFRHMVHCHKQFNNPMAFAGGAWKWGGMSPSNYFSLYANTMHLKVARDEHVPLVIATAWGDDGAETSNFAIMATLQQYAEYMYANGEDQAWLNKRFEETFGLAFDDFILLDTPNLVTGENPHRHPQNFAKFLMYNDPLGGWMDCWVAPTLSEEYAEKQKKVAAVKPNQFSYLFDTCEALCRVLSLKATLSLDLRNAYMAGDRDTMAAICRDRIPATIKALDTYLVCARKEWYYDNKISGFSTVEVRIGGLKERLNSTKLLVEQYLNGEVDTIEELSHEALKVNSSFCRWGTCASGTKL